VNEALYTNAHGLRLIQEFEGAPRLTSRLCEGGAWELGFGVTFNLEGAPFKEGDTCTPEYADALFRHALQLFEDGVRELVTVPLNGNQFSALVAFSYNIGLENFRTSSVLRRVNENRMDDASVCFGMWVFATKGGHKQALRGLLRRRYAEACLFMSYEWTQACSDDAIALQREIPETLPGTDRVIYRTPFKDVLMVAQRYPLPPADELVLSQPAPPLATTGSKVAGGTAGATPSPAPAATPQVSPAPVVPVPAKKPEAVPAPPAQPPRAPVPKPPSKFSVPIESAPYQIDQSLGLKPMESTERWQASLAQNGGKLLMRLARYGTFGAAPTTVATFVEKDPLFAGAFVAACGFAGLYAIGYVRKSYGDFCRHHAERRASQAMV